MYCLDDNARALMLLVLLEESGIVERRAVRRIATSYLAFVSHAFHRPSGRFRNFLTYERAWGEAQGSEDSHGRAVWALGTVMRHARDPGRQSLSGDLFHAALPALESFSSPRAWAYALLGIDEYLQAFGGDTSVQGMRASLVGRLVDLHSRSRGEGWPWFEDQITYGNSRLPQALIVSGSAMGREEIAHLGLESLEWLAQVQRTTAGYFAPIGSNGFFVRGGTPARYDQQPVEACGMVSACLDAHRITGAARWMTYANAAFGWFLGQNDLHQPLYDASTGGCRDGLHADRVNENQGAESTISFLLALRDMRSGNR